MADLSKMECLVIWSGIEDVIFDLFQRVRNETTLVTPEVERDFFEFRRVMRDSVNKTEHPEKLNFSVFYKILPGNKWIPIMKYIYAREKAHQKKLCEMNPKESRAYIKAMDKCFEKVREQAEEIEKNAQHLH